MTFRNFRFFFSSRRRHTRLQGDWSSDVCSSDLCAICWFLNWWLAANTHLPCNYWGSNFSDERSVCVQVSVSYGQVYNLLDGFLYIMCSQQDVANIKRISLIADVQGIAALSVIYFTIGLLEIQHVSLGNNLKKKSLW